MSKLTKNKIGSLLKEYFLANETIKILSVKTPTEEQKKFMFHYGVLLAPAEFDENGKVKKDSNGEVIKNFNLSYEDRVFEINQNQQKINEISERLKEVDLKHLIF